MEISKKKHYISTSPLVTVIIQTIKDGRKNRRGDKTEYIFSFLIAMI